MHIKMIQHAVGQGGLSSGTLTIAGGRLRWAYDCGSNQLDALAAEITQLARDGPLDLLFLSHLDSDHINGVDRLLACCHVREVVLPYFAAEMIAGIIARDSANGCLSGVFLDAAPDIASWLASRGVDIVTFINGADDDDGNNDNVNDDPPFPAQDGERYGPVSAKWSPPPDTTGPEFRSILRTALNAPPTISQTVAAPAALFLDAAQSALNWTLIPHVHAPSARRMRAFRDAIEQLFGGPIDIANVAAAARTEQGRKDLRACYDALWLDHNLVSMTLYAGPRIRDDFGTVLQIGTRQRQGPQAPGWMLTGDAHLDQTRRQANFFQRYRRVIDFVGVLMLPHHGSAHNFDPQLINVMPQLQLGFAASGRNGYGHPHKSVRRAVSARSFAAFHRVSAKTPSRLVADVWLLK